MYKLIQKLFGVRVTVIYKSGAKARARFRQFDMTGMGTSRAKVEWRRPVLSMSRQPIWLNVDEIVAVWQGRH